MRLTLAPEVRDIVVSVSRLLSERGVSAWATGGFLRDSILEREIRDVDVTIDGDPLEAGREVADQAEGHFVLLDEDRRHVRIVRADGPHVDLTPLRAPRLDGDLRLRDFTINALAAALDEVTEEFELIDPTGGLADLRRRTVRMTSERCLEEDP